MARKVAGDKKMTAVSEAIKHVRLELPNDFHGRVRHQADRFGLSVAAYIRLAITERVERDEATKGKDR
jgi:hypothetical protein